MYIERVGSDSGGESCSIFFLEVVGNIGITNRENRYKKTYNFKPFFVKKPKPNFRSFCNQFLHLLTPILPGIAQAIDLLRGQLALAHSLLRSNSCVVAK